MSKKFNNIARETVARWRETLLDHKPGDMDKLKKILRHKNKNAQVFVVDTPTQFYIAQAVIRGRMAKKSAVEACALLGIDSEFVKSLRKTGRASSIMEDHRRWGSMAAHSVIDNVIRDISIKEIDEVTVLEPGKPNSSGAVSAWKFPNRRHSIGRHSLGSAPSMNDAAMFQLNDIQRVYSPLMLTRHSYNKELNAEIQDIDTKLNFKTRSISRAVMSIVDAVSDSPLDILAGRFELKRHMYDAVHSEIIYKAINGKDSATAANFEVFHYTSCIMKFLDAFLVLRLRPVVACDANEQLHSETGAAVTYADGIKIWAMEGRVLVDQGEKIVMTPSALTGQEIVEIRNEEERRIAIERYGWGNYLTDTGAQIMDKRTNWVDNTVEVLFKPKEFPAPPNGWRREEPLRMLLACRSTARKYFIAAPVQPTGPTGAEKLTTCEQVQHWFANGGVTPHLPYASLPLNIIGAS